MYGTKLVGCAKMAEPAQHKRNALREKRRHETHEDVQSASSMAASHSSSGALMRQFNHYLHNELDCPDGCASILYRQKSKPCAEQSRCPRDSLGKEFAAWCVSEQILW
jgi:hypothetical protein